MRTEDQSRSVEVLEGTSDRYSKDDTETKLSLDCKETGRVHLRNIN
jgi:hypothetical protein